MGGKKKGIKGEKDGVRLGGREEGGKETDKEGSWVVTPVT